MKQNYFSPSVKVYDVDETDILTASQGFDDGENTKPLPNGWWTE